MRYPLVALAFALPAAIAAPGGVPEEAAPWLVKLVSDNAAERREAQEALAPFGLPVIDALCELMGEADRTIDLSARHALDRVVHCAAGPGRESQRRSVAGALTRRIALAPSVRTQTYLLDLLSQIGDDACAPPVAALLDNPGLAGPARRCLIRLPGEAATAALLTALRRAEPEHRATLIDALAQRKDPAAFDAFRAALGDDADEVRAAALHALSCLATAECEPLLRDHLRAASPQVRRAARAAYLRLAEALLEAGNAAEARRLYRLILQQADAPANFRAAGLTGLAAIPAEEALGLSLSALDDPEPAMRQAGRQALIDLEAPGVSKALAERMAGATTDRRVELTEILGARRETDSLSLLLTLAEGDPDEPVAVAALQAVGRLGDPSAAPTLVRLVQDTEGLRREDAASTLRLLAGPEVAQAIVEGLTVASPDTKPHLLRALAGRDPRTTVPLLIESLTDPDEAIRLAAEETLSRSAPWTWQPLVLSRLDWTEPPLCAALIRALAATPSPELKLTFLVAAKSKHDEVAIAGLEALVALGDASVSGVLENLAEEGSPPVRAAAIGGLLQLGEAHAKEDERTALRLCHRALHLASTDDMRKQALDALKAIASPQSLPLILPRLTQGNLQSKAAEAVFAISDRMVEHGERDRPCELLRQVTRYVDDTNVLLAAAPRLRRLGIDYDLAAENGLLTKWWVCGPVGKRAELLKTDAFDPTAPVDVLASPRIGNRQHPWRFVQVDNLDGLLDLEVTAGRKDDVGAYCYAEVESPIDQPALAKIGSDDDFTLWLNGEKVAEFRGDRAWKADENTAEVRLREGTNTILLEVLNGKLQWSCSLRFTHPAGAPLKLAQLDARGALSRRGYVTQWRLVGPVSTRDHLLTNDLLDPTAGIDVTQDLMVDGQPHAWSEYTLTGTTGMVDLEAILGPKSETGAYAYAELFSPSEQKVLLKLGSDDDMACWLNGAKVAESHEPRAWKPDQNTVEVTLREGRNTLLLKCLNAGGHWGLSARFTDLEGKAFVPESSSPGSSRQAAQEVNDDAPS